MSEETNDIQQMLEAALKALAESQGEALVRQIHPILLANLDRGRIQSFINGNPDRIQAYVQLVAQHFTRLNPYLRQLQVEKSHEVWEPLYKQMQTWAYNFFLRKGFDGGYNTREIAIECAADAATFLLSAYFPYDTEFEPWAHVTVQHGCRKHMQKNGRKSTIPEDKKVELDDELLDPNMHLLAPGTLQSEFGEDIEQALNQLSEARRTVIKLIFFEELPPDEVAQRMGKSKTAIYTLQFHGLNDLRKILNAIRDNLNE